MAQRIPWDCRRGRHVLEYDSLWVVEVQRCKNCDTIPDPVQAAWWEYEMKLMNKHRDEPLTTRRRKVNAILRAAMQQYNTPPLETSM